MSGLLAMICGAGGQAESMPSILSYSNTGVWDSQLRYLRIANNGCSTLDQNQVLSVSASGGNLQYQWEGALRVQASALDGGTCKNSSGYVTDVANISGGAPYWQNTSTSTLTLAAGAPFHQSQNKYVIHVRCKVSNSVGTVYTPWINLYFEYCEQQTGYTGYQCDPCPYECNCDCGWHTNCCCYDSNGDGITCCDVNNGDVYYCCDRPDQCGEDYQCINCQTCYDYCTTCSGRNPGDSCYCSYYEPEYSYTSGNNALTC
jgi:hypothetical protein